MARLPTPGGDQGAWGSILNDFLAQSLASDGSLKPGTVDSDQLKDAAITTSHLGNSQITTAKIVDGAITAAKVAADVATQAELDTEVSARTTADAALIPLTQKGAASGVATLDSASKIPSAQIPDLSSSYAQIAYTDVGALCGGRRTAYMGDSITIGSGSTNASSYGYVAMTTKIAGSHKVQTFINGGVSGENSTQILARFDAMIAQRPGLIFVLAGTNDSGQSVALSTFQANIIAMMTKAKVAGIPIAFGTVPPRSAAASANIHTLIHTYNLWLRTWSSLAGVPIAETYGAVVDATTGYLASANDSGDGIHPSDAGHLALAQAVAATLRAMIRDQPWPVLAPAPNTGLIANPLMDGAGTVPTGWSNLNGSFASPTFAIVNSTGSDGLPAGRWASMTLDGVGTGNSGYRNFARSLSGWAVGDKLLVCAYVKCSDNAGTGTKLQWLNSSTAGISTILEFPGTGSPGPIMRTFTVPAGTTGLYLALTGSANNSQTITFYLGACNVFNLTSLGLAAEF